MFVMRPVPFIDDLASVDLSKKTSIRFLSKRVAEPLSSLHAFKSFVLINTSKPGTRRTFSPPPEFELSSLLLLDGDVLLRDDERSLDECDLFEHISSLILYSRNNKKKKSNYII